MPVPDDATGWEAAGEEIASLPATRLAGVA